MILTRDQVQQLTGDADRWLDALNNALIRWEITTPDRVAMFLAQCAHESGGFRHLVENLHYSAAGLLRTWPRRFTPEEAMSFAFDERRIAERVYGGRLGNSPEGTGDGYRYRGRGIVQLTGRANYLNASTALGLDFVTEPELLEKPDWAAQAAGWFWSVHGCNALADAGDFEGITRRINGGLNGQDDRVAWLAKVRSILGPEPTPSALATELATPQEAPMGVAFPLLASLIPQVLQLFSGRAQAQLAKVTGDPKLSSDFMQSVITKVGEVTGVPVTDDKSAVQAVAAITGNPDPAKVAQVEEHALDYLDKIAPLMDKLAKHELEVRKAADDSADRASARGKKDGKDIGPMLAAAGIAIFAVALVTVGVVLAVQVYKDPQHNLDGALVGLLTILIYAAARIAESAYRYRFGGSADSAVVDSGNAAVRAAIPPRKD